MKIIFLTFKCVLIVDDEYLEKYLAYLKMIKPNLLQYITIIMHSNNYNTKVY